MRMKKSSRIYSVSRYSSPHHMIFFYYSIVKVTFCATVESLKFRNFLISESKRYYEVFKQIVGLSNLLNDKYILIYI